MELYQNYKGPQLSIGSGGGISGEYNEYILFENGSFYHKNSFEKGIKFIGSIPANEAKQIFKNYFTLKFDDIELNSPGDFSYFIKFGDKVKNHKLIWANSSKIEPKVKVFYDILRSKVKKLSGK